MGLTYSLVSPPPPRPWLRTGHRGFLVTLEAVTGYLQAQGEVGHPAASAPACTAALVFLEEAGLTFPHPLWSCRAVRRTLSTVIKGLVGLIDTRVNSDPCFQTPLGDRSQAGVTVLKM